MTADLHNRAAQDARSLLTLEVGEWGGKMAEFEDQLPDSVKFDYVRIYQK